MVAAATTSLPERADTGRDYDYRYAWVRDQCYAGIAVAAHGPHSLLDRAVRFVAERVLEDDADLRPAYTVNGGPSLRNRAFHSSATPAAATGPGTGRAPDGFQTLRVSGQSHRETAQG